MRDTLTVFGSINIDIAVRVARLPGAGETQLGGEARLSPGGKGANQAHAARRFGVPTQMIGAVGDDAFASPALAGLLASGVDLGGEGALLARRDGRSHACPALAVEVVDTTGAGDTFAGVFGAALVLGLPAARALHSAVVAASLACRHAGAQSAQPQRLQIDAAVGAGPTDLS